MPAHGTRALRSGGIPDSASLDGFTVTKWLRLHAFESQEDADHMAEGLRKAGLPD